MKTFKPITLLFFLFLASYSFAAISPAAPKTGFDLSTIKIKDLEKRTGKKLGFIQKVKFKILQKALKKFKAGEITDRQQKQANLSMILGISSLGLLLLSGVALIGFLSILCIPAAILAIIFGARSLKGNSNTKGIVGVITGGLTLAIIALVIILLALFFTGFSFE